jgi:demethoxyubiquinone hydroxylase (CLK1/Coq7/Cat5 family)
VNDAMVNFPNQIVPIFTKFGCNGGGCHGKIAGQNGFRLSLLGFEPREDYEHLVRETRGRRLFPASPDSSLLLQKSIGSVPHGGGQRMDLDSHEYRVLRRWIAQAMPYGNENDRKVTSIIVTPSVRQMVRNSEQQLSVTATYSDGSTEDITRTAQYESNNLDMAEVTQAGLVKVRDLAGEVSIMARYQGQVTVFRASIPLGTSVTDFPVARGPIDQAVFAKLQSLGIPPSSLCDDATFLRRATLDIAGRLPTIAEVESFQREAAATNDPDTVSATQKRREALVDRLLQSGEYADYFASKWSAILRNQHVNEETRYGAYAFHDWIRQSMFENKPIDRFVRELLTASGDVETNPAVVWLRQVNNTESRIEDAAQLFLGQRLQCARCHHHPYEKWGQGDYYQMAAFFSTVERKDGTSASEPRFIVRVAKASAQNPKSGQAMAPAGLDAQHREMNNYDDPRTALADWMTAPNNPFFAKSIANRYWKHFLGRGLVEPEDDMRVTNPPSNPELLDALAQQLVQSGFDARSLVRAICTSSTYQLSSSANELNLRDTNCYSRYYPKRLNAEVLLDAVDDVSGSRTQFDRMPAGTRAVQLPDTSFASYFLTVFGRPDSSTACECERMTSATLAQSLHLLNSKEMQSKLGADGSYAARWSAAGPNNVAPTEGGANAAALTPAEQLRAAAPQRIRELYLRAFSREPSPSEATVALEYLIQKSNNVREAYEDLIWGVVNSKEFLFNH